MVYKEICERIENEIRTHIYLYIYIRIYMFSIFPEWLMCLCKTKQRQCDIVKICIRFYMCSCWFLRWNPVPHNVNERKFHAITCLGRENRSKSLFFVYICTKIKDYIYVGFGVVLGRILVYKYTCDLWCIQTQAGDHAHVFQHLWWWRSK